MKKYAVCCSKYGGVIDVFGTHEEAANALTKYEEYDLKKSVYEDGFYTIKEVEV